MDNEVGMTKVEMVEDYKFAELPQYGGQIFDAKKDEIHRVSLACAEDLCVAKKAKRVADEILSEEEKAEATELKEGDACAMEDGSEGVVKDGECVKKPEGSVLGKLNPFQKDKDNAKS